MIRKATPILINEGNLGSGVLERERDVIDNGTIWHKIFVRNALQYERDYVLRIFMDAVHPCDFIPVKYTVEGDNVSFLIKNCSRALDVIFSRNLTIANPKSARYPFKVAMLLHFGVNVQVDVQASITRVLKKRYNPRTKVLNLVAFHRDPDLAEFCPLSQPKLLYFVLHISKMYEYRTLKLCDNDIESLKPIEAIATMKNLLSVDLRKNKISSFLELQVLNHWSIMEIALEENPVCNNCYEGTYIDNVRRHCPKIQKLDGFLIPPPTIFACSFRRNFLCDKTGFDLAEQFVEHYFSIYDSATRGSLESMYTKTTVFTVTATYIQGCSSFSNAKLGPYINVSHNINKCADISKTVTSVHVGAQTIANVLTQLPNTEHDPHTFTVDLLYYSEKSAVINITGVFRESGDSLLEVDRMVGFMRTFVLMSVGNNAGFTDEFVIINEMLNVSNAVPAQEARAFKSGSSDIFQDSQFLHQQHVEVAPARTQSDETQFIDALMKIAGLNSKWANKCLEEANYDLYKALNLFVELFKVDKIPDAAFLSQDEITKLTTASPVKVTAVRNISPTDSSSPIVPEAHVYVPPYITDDRANPYSNDPFDTSQPYQGIDRRSRWMDRDLEREKDLELERERLREKERDRIREREREREQRERERHTERTKEKIRFSPPSRAKSPARHHHTPTSNTPAVKSNSNAPAIRSNFGISDPFGRKKSKSGPRSNDTIKVIDTIDLDVQNTQPKGESSSKQLPRAVNSAQEPSGLNKSAVTPLVSPVVAPVPAPVAKPVTQESTIPKPAVQSTQPIQIRGKHAFILNTQKQELNKLWNSEDIDGLLNNMRNMNDLYDQSKLKEIKEISMTELTEYENKLSNLRGHPNQQQKEIQAILDKLFAQYPQDIKVWLLGIGTHYKIQLPQKAREMKNRAIRTFAMAPQLSFQIKLAAAQMEMEYVSGPRFSLADKKVGEQNFLQILQQTPNNLNIVKMFATCLIKRYASDENVDAWDLFKTATSKIQLKLPGGPQDFFDNCRADVI